MMRKKSWVASFLFTLVLVLIAPRGASAYWYDVWAAPYSWDPGLYAVVGNIASDTHAWGMRKTSGAWGTGPVNYQSGSTGINRSNSSGILSVQIEGTYCPGGACSYGSGSGYKGLVQFWNDPLNYVAIGLIHDPGVSPSGTTLMVEGASGGTPIGGYWAGGAITGTTHNFYFTWDTDTLSVVIDSRQDLKLTYNLAINNPSVSFLGAARNTGDIVDVTFTEKPYTSAMFASYPYALVW